MSIDFFARNAPEDICLNVSNGNAGTCLAMLGQDIDYCGNIPVDKLESVWGTLQNHKPREFVRETEYHENFINCGLPLERIFYYFTHLDSLLVF